MQAARTFSDPPLNSITATKSADTIVLNNTELSVRAEGLLGTLPDGSYQFGFRPHQLRTKQASPNAIAIETEVVLTEITGSESFIHVIALGERWTALANGIHNNTMGSKLTLYLDLGDLFVFDRVGAAVSGGGKASHG
jgi:glycerol transport system ATP-binding protein